MITYKKLIFYTISFTIFYSCHASDTYDNLKSRLNRTYSAIFFPDPTKLSYDNFIHDKNARKKLNNFDTVMVDVFEFIQEHNHGVFLETCDMLQKTSKTLLVEVTNLINNLLDIKLHPAKENVCVNHIGTFEGIHHRVIKTRDKVESMLHIYISSEQKNSCKLLIYALQKLSNAAKATFFSIRDLCKDMGILEWKQ